MPPAATVGIDFSLETYETSRRFLASLRQTQWLPPADLARYQLPLIERLCRHAALETDFNAERLLGLFENRDPRQGRFLFENWRDVPIFSRADAQPVNSSLHARNVPEVAGATRQLTTSGSTGRPLAFGKSTLADIAGLAASELTFETHGFDPAARMGWILFVPNKENWIERETKSWTLRNPDAELFMLSKAVPISHCVAWLRRVRPRYLMAPPSMVAGIIGELRRDGGDPVKLDRILVTSETPAEGLAEEVEAVFGARLVDSYGGQEVGEIACTCAEHGPAKHVAADIMLVEIIRPDGAVAAQGEMGSVVVTPFYNYATPLIRYDIGDLAIQGAAACACGRRLPLIERVLGRQHALFHFKDGSTRFPVGLNGMRRYLPWLQMQAVQTHLDRVEIRYVPDPRGASPDLEAATRVAHRALHTDLSVEFVSMSHIEQSQGGKFERSCFAGEALGFTRNDPAFKMADFRGVMNLEGMPDADQILGHVHGRVILAGMVDQAFAAGSEVETDAGGRR